MEDVGASHAIPLKAASALISFLAEPGVVKPAASAWLGRGTHFSRNEPSNQALVASGR